MTKTTFKIEGMHCKSCEKIIEKAVKNISGLKSIKTSYEKGIGKLTHDPETSLEEIFEHIENKGYSCSLKKESESNLGATLMSIAGIALVFYFGMQLYGTFNIPELTANMSYGLLFLVGLLTGFHCISMCGGFIVSYSARDAQKGKSSHKSHAYYAIGKTLSYTIIGAIFGFLGSIIAFTPKIRGVAGILAGLFLIIFGLNMLNIFPTLRKIRLHTPRFISRFVGKESRKHSNPLLIGLLNGLMIACGPLQAIYIMAAGTGSAIEGAKLLFIFGLGTLPVLLGFGYLTSLVSRQATHKILKASGAIVIILGLIMLNRGLALTGSGLDANSLIPPKTGSEKITTNTIVVEEGFQTINMDVLRSGYSPNEFILKKGIPVKWVIEGKEITGCNKAIQVPDLDMNFDIRPGTQTIEFTPEETGVISWSCWMGMIPGKFVVVDDETSLNKASDLAINNPEVKDKAASNLQPLEEKPAGSCGLGGCGSTGGGCGSGCGCGG